MAVPVRKAKETKVIALVEDDPRLIEMVQAVIEAVNSWQLHVFPDGQEARERLPHIGADLILLDVGLPNLDGVSLYRILRGHSQTKHIPIIVITGSYEWELHRMGLHTGLMLRKPFSVQELLFLMRALLAEEPEQQEPAQG
ncbi:response regulator transcription factor [Thermogemmatispora sp.]|uniref:response regulator transcription factor n=1 Tax=Thermogemmatispora sp. TaxID=1968838 RepID=UPI001DD32C81|nr:response regulator [Thermogemmatispora sp.]MBX5449113.1 response regulator transcription factor [Thermogemmatispora sp.]